MKDQAVGIQRRQEEERQLRADLDRACQEGRRHSATAAAATAAAEEQRRIAREAHRLASQRLSELERSARDKEMLEGKALDLKVRKHQSSLYRWFDAHVSMNLQQRVRELEEALLRGRSSAGACVHCSGGPQAAASGEGGAPPATPSRQLAAARDRAALLERRNDALQVGLWERG